MSENGRRSLPRPRGSPRPLSIWTLLKDLIGISDLQSLPFPVDMIGPYTDGMIGAEHVMYTDLLDKAATEPKGSLERLSFVAAYTVAAYSLYPLKRTDKALDPLLNETFECIDEERAVRYISESVHARPRIQAECMEGQKWVLEGESEPRVVVWAHCLEFRVNWYQQVTFHDGEVYSWRKIPTFVYGGLKGVDHLYLRHKGTLCIRNHSTGFEVHMKFVQPSMLSMKKEAPYDVEGIVLDNGLPVQGISIQGQWNDKLYLMRSGHAPQLLWQAVPYPPLPSRYNWTYWSIMLGEIKPGMEQTLPCTDSRFRPDRILMSMDCMKMRMQSIEDYCVLMKLAQAPRRSQKSRCAKLTLLCGLTSMTQVSNLARV
eukprot:jgi/Botrbrau1/22089/Bobra.0206s0015.1